MGLIALWLTVVILQSIGKLKFGKVKIPKSWAAYMVVSVIMLFGLDYLVFKLESPLIVSAYPIWFIYIVVFNSAIIFDWYGITQKVNRVEHIFGSVIIMLIMFALVRELDIFPGASLEALLAASVGFSSIVASMNEIVELFLDGSFGTSEVGPGKDDTNWDLLMNMIGFTIFVVLALVGVIVL